MAGGADLIRSTLQGQLSKLTDRKVGIYDFRVAAVLCFALSAMLWWIPVLGPAVAGYVCGRKTGSLVKGAIVATLSTALLMGIMILLSQTVLRAGGFPGVPADEAAASLSGLAGLIGSYTETFFVQGTSSADFSMMGLTIVFSVIGGTLTWQIRKETEGLLSKGASHYSLRATSRSAEMYARKEDLGFRCFEDCIAAQGMNVNRNPGSRRSDAPETSIPVNTFERKPVTATVQTSTASEHSTTAAESGGPFTDILQRADKPNGNRRL